MKKSNLIVALVLAIPFLVNAQWISKEKIKGNGNVVSKNITTSSYDKVLVTGFFDVDLISGEEGKISIQGEENLIDFVEIKVENNALKIAVEKGKNIVPSKGKKIQISVPFESLNEVSLCGSGDINSKNNITATEFKTELSGSGDIHLNVNAKNVNAEVSGSGDMILKGKSDTFKCSVTGSGDLNAGELISADVYSKVIGSGDCKVHCSENLEARVTGSGDINYLGNPKKKDTKVTGSGDISKG
jgi:uncharacterized protein YktA (UPF0223 family)